MHEPENCLALKLVSSQGQLHSLTHQNDVHTLTWAVGPGFYMERFQRLNPGTLVIGGKCQVHNFPFKDAISAGPPSRRTFTVLAGNILISPQS